MPEFLERKLKAEYGADSKVPYKIMNAKGLMHGNKETVKGEAMERKHVDKGHANVRNPKSHAEKLRHV